jgi:hypothetical protein
LFGVVTHDVFTQKRLTHGIGVGIGRGGRKCNLLRKNEGFDVLEAGTKLIDIDVEELTVFSGSL